MDTISDKKYPIQITEVLIYVFIIVMLSPLIYLYIAFDFHSDRKSSQLTDPYISIFALLVTGGFALYWIGGLILSRRNFHYILEDKFIKINQGVFTLKESYLPYGVIQNVTIKQGVLERLCRIASLKVESTANAGWEKIQTKNTPTELKPPTFGGYSVGQLSIPGLKKEHAEELKAIILEKVKDNPRKDVKSGI